MQHGIPDDAPIFRMTDGPFTAGDTAFLTVIPSATLAHWTNKGYMGEGKLGLGRGSRRLYTAGEVEILAVAKELVDCGIAPRAAIELSSLVVAKAETLLATGLKGIEDDKAMRAVLQRAAVS